MIVINEVYNKVYKARKTNPKKGYRKWKFPEERSNKKEKGEASYKDTIDILPVRKDFLPRSFHQKFIENVMLKGFWKGGFGKNYKGLILKIKIV